MGNSKKELVPQSFQFTVLYNTALSEAERELLPIEEALNIVAPVISPQAYQAMAMAIHETVYPVERGRQMIEQFVANHSGASLTSRSQMMRPGDIVLSDRDGTWMLLPLRGLCELSKRDAERVRESFLYAVLPPWKRYDERDYC